MVFYLPRMSTKYCRLTYLTYTSLSSLITEEVKYKHPKITYADLYQVTETVTVV